MRGEGCSAWANPRVCARSRTADAPRGRTRATTRAPPREARTRTRNSPRRDGEVAPGWISVLVASPSPRPRGPRAPSSWTRPSGAVRGRIEGREALRLAANAAARGGRTAASACTPTPVSNGTREPDTRNSSGDTPSADPLSPHTTSCPRHPSRGASRARTSPRDAPAERPRAPKIVVPEIKNERRISDTEARRRRRRRRRAQVVPDVVRGHHAVSAKVRGAHTASVPTRVEVFESLAGEPSARDGVALRHEPPGGGAEGGRSSTGAPQSRFGQRARRARPSGIEPSRARNANRRLPPTPARDSASPRRVLEPRPGRRVLRREGEGARGRRRRLRRRRRPQLVRFVLRLGERRSAKRRAALATATGAVEWAAIRVAFASFAFRRARHGTTGVRASGRLARRPRPSSCIRFLTR